MKIGLGEGITLNVAGDWNCAEEGESCRPTLAGQASQAEGIKGHSLELTLVDVQYTDVEVMRPDVPTGICDAIVRRIEGEDNIPKLTYGRVIISLLHDQGHRWYASRAPDVCKR